MFVVFLVIAFQVGMSNSGASRKLASQLKTLHDERDNLVFLIIWIFMTYLLIFISGVCIIDIVLGFQTLYDVALIIYNIEVFLVFVCLHFFTYCIRG